MFEKLKFYLEHSYDDLKVNPQRTLFVMICIGAGVGAIIALQNLGVMIEDAFLGNLQARNRGDIALGIIEEFSEETFEDDTTYDQKIARGKRQGTIEEVTLAIDENETMTIFTMKMVATLEEWGAENYDGEFEVTYASLAGGDPIGILLGSAPGAIIYGSNDNNATNQTVVFIDPATYPFYSEVRTIGDDRNIAGLLDDPRNIILSERTSVILDAKVGDTVRVNRLEGDFKVAGIVEDSTEVRGFDFDLVMGIFGYYYMNAEALTQFSEEPIRPTGVYIKIDDPERANEIANAITEDYPYLQSTTPDELKDVYEEISYRISQILSAMGILSILLGSIGIVNTMQVVVRKRMLEVAVLKTIGIKGKQITILFLVEALILGILGSLMGIAFGTLGTFFVKDFGEQLTRQTLVFRVTPMPIIAGVVVGMVVTTIFGFLPTLSAAKIRPAMVIRPQEKAKFRAGCIPMLFSLGLMVVILTFTVYQMVDIELPYAFGFTIGTFLASAILFPILWLLIWGVARLFPNVGSAELSLAKTELRINRSRNAFVLLALVIGIFSLSSILLFADAFTSLLDSLLEETSGGRTVFAQVFNPADAPKARAVIEQNKYVEEFSENRTYNTRFISLEMQNGRTVTYEEIEPIVDASGIKEPENDDEPPQPIDYDPANQYAYGLYFGTENIRALDSHLLDLDAENIETGRMLNTDDIANPGIIVRKSDWVDQLGVQVGDQITLKFVRGNNTDRGEDLTFTIVGIYSPEDEEMQIGNYTELFTLNETVPAEITPAEAYFSIKMPENKVGTLQRDMQAVPNAFVIDLRIISTLINAFLGQIKAFPLLFGGLGLVTGAVVIANSVSLSTLERRRDIAVLKAIGLKRFRVLIMILVENLLLGFVGAIFGVGFGVTALVLFEYFNEGLDLDINWTVAVAIAFLSMGIAVVAALFSAWGASGEKPLNVLRYE